jgi:hypothetical protein
VRDAAFNLRALPEPRIAWMVSRVAAALNDWLKRRAMVNHMGGASRTFVVADKEQRVFGYYVMAAGAVSHQLSTGPVRRNIPDQGC